MAKYRHLTQRVRQSLYRRRVFTTSLAWQVALLFTKVDRRFVAPRLVLVGAGCQVRVPRDGPSSTPAPNGSVRESDKDAGNATLPDFIHRPATRRPIRRSSLSCQQCPEHDPNSV